MAALVDLDLNCCPPSPEEPRLAMLAREQPFSEQVDRHKLYGSFCKKSSAAPSSLHSTHEYKLMSLDERANPNPYVSNSSNERKTHPNAAQQNFDASRSVWRKPDMFVPVKRSYHDKIDLEKPATFDDVSEIVVYSGLGKPANHILRSQESSCCVSPENRSLVETGLLCRELNSFRVSPGSVGSSGTPGCQSPIKQNNTESRHSLFDLNEPQDESLHVFSTSSQEIYPALLHSSSPCPGVFSKKSSQVFQKQVGSSIGSLEESSITVMVPNSSSSKNVAAASLVQREGLIDLNVPLESSDVPSENFSSFMHHPVSTTHGINKSQSKILMPGIPLVDNHVHPKPGVSHDGPLNSQMDVSMLGAGAESDDIVVATAAETLLSIFRHNSACTANTPERNSQISARDGNNEPQCSLDSFEKVVLNLEEVRDDGQSIPVIPLDKDAPACGIKLKRGRGMRNFQREIIPGLVSLARQDICDDLHAIGYEPKKTRSRKARRGQGASSSRSRSRKRSTTTRN